MFVFTFGRLFTFATITILQPFPFLRCDFCFYLLFVKSVIWKMDGGPILCLIKYAMFPLYAHNILWIRKFTNLPFFMYVACYYILFSVPYCLHLLIIDLIISFICRGHCFNCITNCLIFLTKARHI